MNIKINTNTKKEAENIINSQKKLITKSSTSNESRYCFHTKEIPIIPVPFLDRKMSNYKNNLIVQGINKLAKNNLDTINIILEKENAIEYDNRTCIIDLVYKACHGTLKICQLGLTERFATALTKRPAEISKNTTDDQMFNIKVCYKALTWIVLRKIGFEKEQREFKNQEFENHSDIMIQDIGSMLDEAITQFEQIKEKHFAILQIFVNPDFGCIAKYLKTLAHFGGNARMDIEFIAPRLIHLSESIICNLAAEFCMLQNLTDCFIIIKQLPKTFNNTLAVHNVLEKYCTNLTAIHSSALKEHESLKKDYPGNPLYYYANLSDIVSKVQSLQDHFSLLLTKTKTINIIEENNSSNQDTLSMPVPISIEPQDVGLQTESDPIDIATKIEENIDLQPEKIVSTELSTEKNLALEVKVEEKIQFIPQVPLLLNPNDEAHNKENVDPIEQELIPYFDEIRRFVEKGREKKQKSIQEKQEAIQRAILQKREAKKIEEMVPKIIEKKLEVRDLNDLQIKTLKAIFSDLPDFTISGKEVKNLITNGLGGTITKPGGNKKHIHFAGSLKKAGEYEVAHQSDRGYLTAGWANRLKNAITYAIQKPLIAIEPSLELELFGEIIRQP